MKTTWAMVALKFWGQTLAPMKPEGKVDGGVVQAMGGAAAR